MGGVDDGAVDGWCFRDRACFWGMLQIVNVHLADLAEPSGSSANEMYANLYIVNSPHSQSLIGQHFDILDASLDSSGLNCFELGGACLLVFPKGLLGR
jgi:hypothetical protein